MATSGNFLTSDSGQGGGNFYGRTIFEWWRTDWGRSGSQGYHNISFTHKTYGGSGGYWQYFYQGSMNVDGSGYGYASPIQAYGAGATTLGSGSKTLYTDSAGNRSFGASAQGGVYYNTINTSGSGSWALDNIPMYGDINAISFSPAGALTDESTSVTVDWYKYAGTAHIWFRLDQINNSDGTHHKIGMADPYTWTGWQTWLRTTMVNTNSTTLYIYYGDDLDSNGSVDRWDTPNTYTVTIKNDAGQANPTFVDFDYIDTNGTTTAITGNNQVLIQGKSTLQATVAVADKATPNKNANMSTYLFTVGGYSSSSAWSNVADVVKNIGAVSDVSGVQSLSVKAIDSRTNFKTVTKSVEILPYASPAFVGAFNVKYDNDYDTSDGITVIADGTRIASVSPLTLSGTDKNSVNGTTGVQFDVSKGNNTSYTGTWVNVATSFGTNTGDITTTLATLEAAILTKINGLTADNTVRWYVKFRITDALETTNFETFIDIGKPIFRIGFDGNVYNNEEQLLVIPMISRLADDLAAAATNGTGTVTPWSSGINTLHCVHGAGSGNSSTIVFDVSFSFWAATSTGARTWALKLDGVAIGDSARKLYIDTLSNHTYVSSTIVATGVSAGTHTITLELYGGGLDIRADTADYLTIVATEYADAYVS